MLMKTWQKIFAGLIAAAMAASISGCAADDAPSDEPPASEVNVSAAWPTFENVEEISRQADLVIEAEFVSSWEGQTTPAFDVTYDPPSAELKAGHIPTTINGVSIITVLKGDATPGETLDVVQLGGRLDGNHYVERNTTLVAEAESDSVVLFLTLPDAGAYQAMNPTQGMFLTNSDGADTPLTEESGFQVTTLDELQARVGGA